MRYIADMDAGRIVERGAARGVTSLRHHPRTLELLVAAAALSLEEAGP